MSFKQYLGEAYSPKMAKALGSYKKIVGDWLANRFNFSIQNMNFEEVPLDNSDTFENLISPDGAIDKYVYSKRGQKKEVIVICKYSSQGITVHRCSINGGINCYDDRKKEFGDTSGKVTQAFICFGTVDNGYYRSNGFDMGNIRYERRHNKDATTDEKNHKRLQHLITLKNNPVCKEIKERARRLGLKNFELYAKKDTFYSDGREWLVVIDYDCDEDVENAVEISFSNRYSDLYKNTDHHLNIKFSCLIHKCDIEYGYESGDNIDKILSDYNNALIIVSGLTGFVNYLNTLTVKDVLVYE